VNAQTQSLPISLPDLQAASLGGDGQTMTPAMQLALDSNFGSVTLWRDAFIALAKGMGSDAAALLSFHPRDGALINHSLAVHESATHVIPMLALSGGHTIDHFMSSIHWDGVYERYQAAVHATSDALAATADDVAGAMLLDVRRAGMFEKAATMLPGAQWRDPSTVSAWAQDLPRDRDLIVYCIYGHEVGRSTAMKLHAAGHRARFLQGGIDAWQTEGRPLMSKITTTPAVKGEAP
jgi:superoxide dismutase, Fe-Mn family